MKKPLLLALTLALAPFACNSTELSYTYVEGGAARTYHADRGNRGYDGGYVRGSFALNDHFYTYGSYTRTSAEASGFNDMLMTRVNYDFEDSLFQIGLGGHYPLSDHTDVLVELAYLRDELRSHHDYKDPYFKDSSWKEVGDGGQLSLGLRESFTSHIEGWLKVGYLAFDREFEAGHGEFVGEAGGNIRINPRWGIVANAQFLDDITSYQLGVRASF